MRYGLFFALIKRTFAIFRTTFSRGCPFFSYIASRKNGSITNIMTIEAVLVCVCGLRMKKSGTPIIAPPPKQMICRFVKLKRNFVFTFVRRYV